MSPWFDDAMLFTCCLCRNLYEHWPGEIDFDMCHECRRIPEVIPSRALADCLGFLERELKEKSA